MSLHILDTDTLTLYQESHPRVYQHCAAQPPQDLAITVISVDNICAARSPS